MTAADIRLCTKDTVFSVKETNVGIVADLGAWAMPICVVVAVRSTYADMSSRESPNQNTVSVPSSADIFAELTLLRFCPASYQSGCNTVALPARLPSVALTKYAAHAMACGPLF